MTLRGSASSLHPEDGVVVGCDHLDTGSDAIADGPVLNARLNTASGATWTSVHHGGGVGIGTSIHAGQVVCVDGSAKSSKRVSLVLTNDPGIGIARHADAGYDEAKRAAKRNGIRIPM